MPSFPADRGPQADRPASAAVDPPGRLFTRYAWLVAADVAGRGLRFLVDVALGRHFGRETFGQLNLAQSLVVQGMGVAACGLDTAGLRDVASAPSTTPEIAGTVVLLRLLLGVVTWGFIAGVSLLVPQYRDAFDLVALYGLSMFSGALTLGWVAQGRGQANVVAMSVLATNVCYFGGVQAVVYCGWSPVAVPLALIAAETATAAGLWVWIVRSVGPVRRPLPLAQSLRFLRESLPIGGVNVLRGITVGSDVLLLGLFVSKAEVGQFSAAFKLYSLGISLVVLYSSVLLPHLASRAASGSRAELIRTLHAALGKALLAAVPIAAAGLLLARFALRLLFGSGFEGGTGMLQVLILAVPLNLAAAHYRTALIAAGRQRRDLAIAALGAIIHVAAKLSLIPVYGTIGSAWGTLAGEAATLLLAWRIAATSLGGSE